MKKFLPKTLNNPQGFIQHRNGAGFTLIELMVVISIIAILSVVGITLFTGAQKSTRDSVRIQEIGAISAALETNYNNGTAKYALLANSHFAAGAIPADTYSGQAKCGTGGSKWCEYCARTTAGTAMTKGENSATACTAAGSKIDASKPPIDTAYEVCATLEAAPYFYCKVNQR